MIDSKIKPYILGIKAFFSNTTTTTTTLKNYFIRKHSMIWDRRNKLKQYKTKKWNGTKSY